MMTNQQILNRIQRLFFQFYVLANFLTNSHEVADEEESDRLKRCIAKKVSDLHLHWERILGVFGMNISSEIDVENVEFN